MSQHHPTTSIEPFIAPADSPHWFIDNLRHPGESRFVEVNGSAVHCLTWNQELTSLPVLMLVHGFSGHAHWWSYLAPFFTEHFRVVAVDLPGMGDSAPLATYDDDCFADALLAIIDQWQLSPVCLVAHSFGGAQSIRAMAKQPQAFAQGIIVDTYITLPPENPTPVIDARGSHRVRASQAECIADFRLSPPQEIEIEAIRQYIAYHSCVGTSAGWHWKFDPGLRNFGELYGDAIMASVPVPVDCIYGERSMFNYDNKPQRILECFGNSGELIIIPNAYHHLMVDHPLELVAAIKQLLAVS